MLLPCMEHCALLNSPNVRSALVISFLLRWISHDKHLRSRIAWSTTASPMLSVIISCNLCHVLLAAQLFVIKVLPFVSSCVYVWHDLLLDCVVYLLSKCHMTHLKSFYPKSDCTPLQYFPAYALASTSVMFFDEICFT